MLKQAESEPYVNVSAYAIGSRVRSLLRLSILAAVGLTLLAVHYLFLFELLPNRTVAILLVIGTWILVILRLHEYVRGWLGFILKDSAYGIATDSGIEYRCMLRPQVLPWSEV